MAVIRMPPSSVRKRTFLAAWLPGEMGGKRSVHFRAFLAKTGQDPPGKVGRKRNG